MRWDILFIYLFNGKHHLQQNRYKVINFLENNILGTFENSAVENVYSGNSHIIDIINLIPIHALDV